MTEVPVVPPGSGPEVALEHRRPAGAARALARGRALLCERDHPDRLSWRHAEAAADLPSGLALRIRQGAVSQPDPDDLGEQPLPGRYGQLGRERTETIGSGQLAVRVRGPNVRIDGGVAVVGDAGPFDHVDHAPPRRTATRIACQEHDDGGHPHPGGQRGLHLRCRRQAEHAGRIASAALRALDKFAHRGKRYQRNEEQMEPASAYSVPVATVASASLAVERSLPYGAEVDPEPEDQQHFAALSRLARRPPPRAR